MGVIEAYERGYKKGVERGKDLIAGVNIEGQPRNCGYMMGEFTEEERKAYRKGYQSGYNKIRVRNIRNKQKLKK